MGGNTMPEYKDIIKDDMTVYEKEIAVYKYLTSGLQATTGILTVINDGENDNDNQNSNYNKTINDSDRNNNRPDTSRLRHFGPPTHKNFPPKRK